jgi:hypothetical protein
MVEFNYETELEGILELSAHIKTLLCKSNEALSNELSTFGDLEEAAIRDKPTTRRAYALHFIAAEFNGLMASFALESFN